jgi:hypothetical protein
MEKFESFYHDPYACYIQRFARDVRDSEYIVFIGSSLGDEHINIWATTAWRLANVYSDEWYDLSPQAKKIMIVTWTDAPIGVSELLSESDIGRRLVGQLSSVGFDGSSDDRLRQNGYAAINKGLLLYMKGTQEFFWDIWQIIDTF